MHIVTKYPEQNFLGKWENSFHQKLFIQKSMDVYRFCIYENGNVGKWAKMQCIVRKFIVIIQIHNGISIQYKHAL